MARWTVTVPIAGSATLEVEAETEEAAIQEALNEVTIKDFDEWEALEYITRGNVCYAPCWSAEATLLQGEEE